jgi:antitoxin component YwqK of YwqJK toxin-antitoxin module
LTKEKYYERPDTTHAPFVLFYPEGGVRLLGQLVDGKPDGRWIRYYEDTGNTQSTCNYKNGILHGKAKSYRHKDNTLWKEEYFVNGQLHGEEKHYHSDGTTLSSLTNHEHGRKNGHYKEWHPDGSLSVSGFYENGELQGEYVRYDKMGKATEKGTYLQGYKHGFFEELQLGKYLSKGEYYYGQKVGTWLYYYPSGNISEACKCPDKSEVEIGEHSYIHDCVFYEEDGSLKKPKRKE